MRIAIVSTVLPPDRGGAEGYTQQLATDLAARHELLVLTATAEAEVPGAELRVLPRLPRWDKSNPRAQKVLWHLRDQWRPAVRRAVARELARFQPDVVHSHILQGLSAAPLTAIRRLGLAHVHTAHDLSLLCLETTMTRSGRPCGGDCLRCAPQRRIRGGAAAASIDRFIAPSRYILDRHVAAGVTSPQDSEVIRHGVRGAPARQRSARADGLTLGFIGTLAAHKGLPTLLRAMDAAPAGWRLLVAGSGPLEPRVREAAARSGRVEYLGYVSGEGKDRFFDATDSLVVPSECEEAAGLVLLEAGVRGIPAVVSDRGGLPEAPEAVVFAAGDPSSLLRAVDSLAERLPDVSARLISRRREFLWEDHLESVERVLERTAAAQRTAVVGDGAPASA
jgi:glycosyltransferase involved in cell wall biosynthesis